MGIYLNPGNSGFQESLNSEIYVDKTELISYTNSVLHTRQKYICVSRPRRFGKSMALDMLASYYGRSVDSDIQFQGLAVSRIKSYRQHLNQYAVIKVNMQEFLSATHSIEEMLTMLKNYLLFDLEEEYSSIRLRDRNNLVQVMKDIYAKTKQSFVILIDEWDCLFREYQQNTAAQKKYLDFLRAWLKDQEFVALAYMTGILPIKKYGTHSALNMFSEYSMTDPGNLAAYFGFTENEVKTLCDRYQMAFEEARSWYDGYMLSAGEWGNSPAKMQEENSIYNPKSVVEAMLHHRFSNYWNRTESYEALKIYIQMNLDGLKDAVISLLGGTRIPVHTGTFSNDMTSFSSKDDVLTLLVHLGYLSYHADDSTVTIPNKEVAQEYVNAIRTMDWSEVSRSIEESRQLLEALWNRDEAAVAAGIERAHEEISALAYHDENSLSCTIQLAFYFAREYYTIIREFPSGKGFADIVLLPRKLHGDKPAAIIELKWDQSAEGALAQIKERNYAGSLKEYQGDLILAGINYDRKAKRHSCVIEKWIL